MQNKKPINIEIGQRLKYYREVAGLTQETFAEMIGLGVKHISAMERGVTGVSISTLINASNILSVPVDYFLFEQMGESEKQNRENEIQLLITRLSRLPDKKFKVVKEIINKVIEALS